MRLGDTVAGRRGRRELRLKGLNGCISLGFPFFSPPPARGPLGHGRKGWERRAGAAGLPAFPPSSAAEGSGGASRSPSAAGAGRSRGVRVCGGVVVGCERAVFVAERSGTLLRALLALRGSPDRTESTARFPRRPVRLLPASPGELPAARSFRGCPAWTTAGLPVAPSCYRGCGCRFPPVSSFWVRPGRLAGTEEQPGRWLLCYPGSSSTSFFLKCQRLVCELFSKECIWLHRQFVSSGVFLVAVFCWWFCLFGFFLNRLFGVLSCLVS